MSDIPADAMGRGRELVKALGMGIAENWAAMIIASALMAERDRARAEALRDALATFGRCVHDGGFDRKIGPIGCRLGDECACLPIGLAIRDLLLNAAPEAPSHE